MTYNDLESWVEREVEDWGDFLTPDELEDYITSQIPIPENEAGERMLNAIYKGLGY